MATNAVRQISDRTEKARWFTDLALALHRLGFKEAAEARLAIVQEMNGDLRSAVFDEDGTVHYLDEPCLVCGEYVNPNFRCPVCAVNRVEDLDPDKSHEMVINGKKWTITAYRTTGGWGAVANSHNESDWVGRRDTGTDALAAIIDRIESKG